MGTRNEDEARALRSSDARAHIRTALGWLPDDDVIRIAEALRRAFPPGAPERDPAEEAAGIIISLANV